MSPPEEIGDAVRPIPAVRTPSVHRDHIAPTSIHTGSLLGKACFKRIDFLPIDDINRRDTIKPRLIKSNRRFDIGLMALLILWIFGI